MATKIYTLSEVQNPVQPDPLDTTLEQELEMLFGDCPTCNVPSYYQSDPDFVLACVGTKALPTDAYEYWYTSGKSKVESDLTYLFHEAVIEPEWDFATSVSYDGKSYDVIARFVYNSDTNFGVLEYSVVADHYDDPF